MEGLGVAAPRYGLLFGVMEIFWNFIVVIIVQYCEYTKNH